MWWRPRASSLPDRRQLQRSSRRRLSSTRRRRRRAAAVGQVVADGLFQVGIELGLAGDGRQVANTREAGAEDLIDVVVQAYRGAPLDAVRSVPGHQSRQRDGGCLQRTFDQTEWSHAEVDNASGSSVHGSLRRGGGAGEDEATWCGIAIDGAPHPVPDLWQSLPLIKDQWVPERRGKAFSQVHELGALVRVVNSDEGLRVLRGRPRFADAAGTLDVHCWKPIEQRSKPGVDETGVRRAHAPLMRSGRSAWVAGWPCDVPRASVCRTLDNEALTIVELKRSLWSVIQTHFRRHLQGRAGDIQTRVM